MNETNYLYELLPRIVRIRDLEQGGSLRTLLGVMDEQRRRIEADIERMYDDLFIETCSPDLVGHLGAVVGADPGATRAEVANTIRVGDEPATLASLARFATDVTGWQATVTQPRPDVVDIVVHAVDTVTSSNVSAARVADGCYTLHPVGLDVSLCADPSSSDGPFIPYLLRNSADRTTLFNHFAIIADGRPVAAANLIIVDLATWGRPSAANTVFLDAERGRLVFGVGQGPTEVRCRFATSAPADAARVEIALERLRVRIADRLPPGVTALVHTAEEPS